MNKPLFTSIHHSCLIRQATACTVVRKHRMRVETMSGLEVEVQYLTASGIQTTSGKVTYQRIIWESEIGISDVDPTSYTLLHGLKKLAVFPSQAPFCEMRPTLSPHNLTIGQLVADDPQDPRLFVSPTSELWLSFFAYPVISSPGETCSSHTGGKMYHAPVPFHWQVDLNDNGSSLRNSRRRTPPSLLVLTG